MKLAFLLLIAAAGVLQPQELSHTVSPRVIHKVDPEYTKEAMDAKVAGEAVLSSMIEVGDFRRISNCFEDGYGLDEKAAECLRHGASAPVFATAKPWR